MFFDSHAHYDDPRFDADRARLLPRLHQNGLSRVVNVGANMASSRSSVALAAQYDFVYAAVGVHPHDAARLTNGDLGALAALTEQPKVVAWGEIGLDYYYDNSPRDIQRKRFADQLAQARSLHLPVIIHSRDAAQETFRLIRDSGVREGVIHCYSGHLPMALDYIQMGFYIGIGGVVTYPSAKKTAEVAAGIPLERLVLETDCPYLTPVPRRGERNDSGNLVYVAEVVACLRDSTPIAVAQATAQNACRLYRLPPLPA
mgnify:FL=1